ncbi:MAG: pyridoxal phosphate-dependent aminotransferase family protein [Verrucomicrobiota bacterium]
MERSGEQYFEEALSALEQDHLLRKLTALDGPQGVRVERSGVPLLNFSSNDYLGLANDPRIRNAFHEGIDRFGAGSGASRLICGTLPAHEALEACLASLKKTEACLCFSTGFGTATGVLQALLDKNTVVILDKLCHASLVDGARNSPATLRVFGHNDLTKLEDLLVWGRKKVGPAGRLYIVTESVFSMDGDTCPLQEIVALKNRFGARLLVDEAHAFGLIGPSGRGWAAELGLESEVDFQMGTLSKAAGVSGGYLCASRPAIDWLINRARSFIYSTAPPPAAAWAARTSVDLIASSDGDRLRNTLRNNVRQLARALDCPAPVSAILPVILGSEDAAIVKATQLLEAGLLVPAIRYPTVARGKARLRIALSAAHSRNDLDQLAAAIKASN